MGTTSETKPMEELIESIEKTEQIESLNYLVTKLPELVQTLKSLEDVSVFVKSTLNDKQSLEAVLSDAETRLGQLNLNQTSFESLAKTIELLPRMVPYLEKLEELLVFFSSVLKDRESLDFVKEDLQKAVEPLNRGVSIVKETNQRFEQKQDDSNVSILRIFKLTKDPSVQRALKYTETMLEVISEKK
ncbi:hypothetical protein [Pseudalkalibacillus caeni]|uniref:DUF1641 domain-containing protein n=1 Tax=Exobacillus caeni TaxID=2574798 RepID=A0A5R9F8V7_9BACL|nr:hypothetical protein [Pseudalkalibacillus caeni]TLS37273.1 hypothetical protein FCL54_12175 [Pseudalkalibacillus caeni]